MSIINPSALGLGNDDIGDNLPIDDGVASLFEGRSNMSPFSSDGASQQFPFGDSGMGLLGTQTGLTTGPLSGMMGGLGSMLNGLFGSIESAISQYFGNSGSNQATDSSQNAYGGNPYEQQFNNVTASSLGDPHDSVNGSLANGQACEAHWDNTGSHHDLLSSNSFAGGFRVSTQAGSPDGSTAAMNQSVNVSGDYGRNQISFDANGNAAISEDGINQPITQGQTMALQGGMSVTDQGNSLKISENSPYGAALATTLSDNGVGGVDVSASGQNVALGGYLIRNAT